MKSVITAFLLVFTVLTASAQTKDRVASTPALGHDWRAGFVNITEFGAGTGLGLVDEPYSKSFFSITTVNGYQFTRNIKAGVGIGIQAYNGGTLLPLFVDARFSLSAQKLVPFIAAASGVELSLRDLGGESRIFIHPSLGVKWVAASKLGLSLSAGILSTSGGGLRDSFVTVKLGAEFKGKEWIR